MTVALGPVDDAVDAVSRLEKSVGSGVTRCVCGFGWKEFGV